MTRQAIVTKYLGPTNHRGARVKASAEAGSLVVSWNHDLSEPENHRQAAEELASKYGWATSMVGGGLPDGRGYAFVMVD